MSRPALHPHIFSLPRDYAPSFEGAKPFIYLDMDQARPDSTRLGAVNPPRYDAVDHVAAPNLRGKKQNE